ncbi:MAG: sigma-70 family RNA polymerase sigma factor [Planctomycetota bacterium]
MLHNMIGNDSPLDRLRKRQGRVVLSTRGGRARAGLSSADEALVQKILSTPIDFIDNPAFYETDAEFNIYEDAPDIARPDVAWYRPLMDDLSPSKPVNMKSTGSVLLTADEERVLFTQYNYARYRVGLLQEEIGSGDPTDEQAQELLRWYRTSTGYREQIAETNLALVLAMAKRTRMSEVDFADLVSEGNMALLRSIDKFDCARGFKFSTYACRAILKAFSRQGMKLSKYRQRFPTDFDPSMEKSNHLETVRKTYEEECADEVKTIVQSNNALLSDIEQTVIHHRFGIDGNDDVSPLTLEQVGQIIGVTKERVRQIQNKALEKIRVAFEESTFRKARGDGSEDEATPTPTVN